MAIPLASSDLLHFLPSTSDPPYDLVKTHPSLVHLTKCKNIKHFKQIHSQIIKFGLHNTQFALSKLLGFCAVSPHGSLSYASSIFDSIENPNHVAHNTMIRGYSLSSFPSLSLHFYVNMLFFGLRPNSYTFPFLLKSCANLITASTGKQIHGHVFKFGLENDVYVHTSLINMYARHRSLDDARKVFDKIPNRDVVSWNAMISGYAQVGRHDEALSLFGEMRRMKINPDTSTLLSVLSACARTGGIETGDWVRTWIEENGLDSNTQLVNAMIDMYAKCGNLCTARNLFDDMPGRDLVSWNVMIGGYTHMSEYKDALEVFRLMQTNEGFKPDEITFVGVLSACCHAGLVNLGRELFNSMVHDYKISPQLQHYGCMIDLLGRAGFFDKAMSLVEKMDIEPDGAIWGSILSACKNYKNLKLAEYAAKKLFELEPNNPGAHVILSNLYAQFGKWDDVARIRTFLNDEGMKKIPGSTSIEIDGIVHEFLVSDRTHPESLEIYRMLEEVDRRLEMAGHVNDTSEVYYDVDEELKEGVLCEHSEKLAIAYGLISTKAGTTLRIVKNLRVCWNCHSATKLISKIFEREIIARDRSRFHHFKDGSCSCVDYW
ncbi:pentatricopeptide repeat-containing protein at1g08070 [Phtheirospermum japonicum]|uniref:Pentatricopeptide repeat-containing protein at1g08070 n=1 Tax=Phtheirospermum japonicum TaxID=374723 RepID=A0A830DDT2_9LAMI|nr:pentatricopeptide repeat-containing protein at1g08070 [Phtheirospermum japonicum]